MRKKLLLFIFVTIWWTIFTLCLVWSIAAETQPAQKKKYTLIVFTAEWCTYCDKLKQSFESKAVKDIVKSSYSNDLHFIDVDLPKNKALVDGYEAKGLPLPHMFLLRRTGPQKGVVLTSKEGYISYVLLANFLRNPEKYSKNLETP